MPKILRFSHFSILLFLHPFIVSWFCLTNVTHHHRRHQKSSIIPFVYVYEYMFWCHCHKFIYIANIIRSENTIKISTQKISVQPFTMSTEFFFFLPLSKVSNIHSYKHAFFLYSNITLFSPSFTMFPLQFTVPSFVFIFIFFNQISYMQETICLSYFRLRNAYKNIFATHISFALLIYLFKMFMFTSNFIVHLLVVL